MERVVMLGYLVTNWKRLLSRLTTAEIARLIAKNVNIIMVIPVTDWPDWFIMVCVTATTSA